MIPDHTIDDPGVSVAPTALRSVLSGQCRRRIASSNGLRTTFRPVRN